MRVLHLTLKKRWFDMVGNGKEEEYRTINRYWWKRLVQCGQIYCNPKEYNFETANTLLPADKWQMIGNKEFDQVLFANGGHFGNVPKKTFEFKGIEIREGRPEWGAEPGKKYFVIKLGKQIS